MEESIEFSNNIFTLEELEEKIKKENEARQIIEKRENDMGTEGANYYNNLKNSDLNQLKKKIISLISKAESLLNRNEQWVKQALKDCLADRDREWRYLYTSTNEILR